MEKVQSHISISASLDFFFFFLIILILQSHKSLLSVCIEGFCLEPCEIAALYRIPLCLCAKAQPPTVDPAIETTAHDIIRARPTHGRNKARPTFIPIPTRWPTFPNCIGYRTFFYVLLRHLSCISRRLCQTESFRQTDEYMVH